MGLQILLNLDHRGAVGADPKAGDGCGMLVQIPHRFFAEECAALGIALAGRRRLRRGPSLLPARSRRPRASAKRIVEKVVADEGQVVPGLARRSGRRLGPWRKREADGTRRSGRSSSRRGKGITDADDFERRLFILRKVISNTIYDMKDPRTKGFYPVSLSSRTITYKGMLLAGQLGDYFKDLQRPAVRVGARARAPAVLDQHLPHVVARPPLPDGRPQRRDQHAARQRELDGRAPGLGRIQSCSDTEISKLWPISYEGQSDTACFDNALEFLVRGGYSLAHAVMMLIPEAWAGNPLMDEDRRAFYEYHAALMEPWDGPAAVAFTDGRQIGATLDRNGLRPARYLVTDDGLVVLASEFGVLPIPEEKIVTKWRLAARQDAADRPRARGASSPTRRSRARCRARTPIANG